MYVQALGLGQAANRLNRVLGRQSELRAVVGCLHGLVRVRLDPGCDADEEARAAEQPRSLELVERVEDDQRVRSGGAPQQLVLLVVAVDHHALAGNAGAQRELELTDGRDVCADALFGEQPQHRDRRERLRPVGDERAGRGRRVGARLGAQGRLVVDDDRRPEFARELARADPAERELAVLDRCGVRQKLDDHVRHCADAVLSALANLAYRRARTIVAIAAGLAIAAALFGASTPKRLTSSDNDFQDRSSQSFRTLAELSRASGVVPGPSILVVGSPRDARVAAARLRREPTIALVAPRAAVGADGRLVLVAAWFKTTATTRGQVASRLARTLPGEVGGAQVADEQVRTQTEDDLLRAELIAFPLLLLLALWIFRGLVAALLPVAAGLLSIFMTLALLRLVNEVQPISVFALNLVTGAGLGLAIDYSLLLVSRFREELVRVGPGLEAVRATLVTAGRTVAFSAVTVAAAFASLLVFPLPFLRSMAIGGIIVAPLAGAVALLLLPALFVLLGERVNSLAPRSWQRAAERAARPDEHGGWYRYAHWVMRRPVRVALASSALLIVLGLPALGVRFIGVDATVLPTSTSARRTTDTLTTSFAPGLDSPLHVAIAATDPARPRPRSGVSRISLRWRAPTVSARGSGRSTSFRKRTR